MTIKELLKLYEVEIKYFTIESTGEEQIIFLIRENLSQNKIIGESDKNILKSLDKKALNLYEKNKNYSSLAVSFLKDVTDIIKNNI